MKLEEINNFIGELDTKNIERGKYQTTYIRLWLQKTVGVLSIGEGMDSGGEWVDKQNSYYFKLNEFYKIIESLKLKNRVNIDCVGFYSHHSSKHDLYYPEEDYRRESVQKGRIKADLELEPESKLLKIINLQFFSIGNKRSWEQSHVRDIHSEEIEKIILSQLI